MEPCYFGSPAEPLFGLLERPSPDSASDVGIVVCPPFGWEEICSHRRLRDLARALAAAGIPTLRFDLPGTGDSGGGGDDLERVDGWLDALDAAVEQLRRATGVPRVALLGVRIGATLAAAAVARGLVVDALILVAPLATGKAYVRELRAFNRLEADEFGSAAPVGRAAIAAGAEETAGFLLGADTIRALGQLDLTRLELLVGQRPAVLLLERTDLPPDVRLRDRLREQAGRLTVQGLTGVPELLLEAQDARLPVGLPAAVIDFLAPSPVALTATPELAGAAMIPWGPGDQPLAERALMIESPSATMLGIVCEPLEARDGNWVVFLNAGATHRIGPNRLWVRLARDIASTAHVRSLRLDLAGVGDSDGDDCCDLSVMYAAAVPTQVNAALATLRRDHGARRITVIGLCSGAHNAFHAALDNLDVTAAVLINPGAFFWHHGLESERDARKAGRSALRVEAWRRLLRGQIAVARVTRSVALTVVHVLRRAPARLIELLTQPSKPEPIAAAFAALDRRGVRSLLVFTEGEPTLEELRAVLARNPSATGSASVEIVRGATHTFRPLWAQAWLCALLAERLPRLLQIEPDQHRAGVT